MTPAQLEHLKLIDVHLTKLLNTAAGRTPGKWKHNDGRRMLISVDSLHEDAILYGDEFEISNSNAAFIASCAGNAEAGWRATRAAIAVILNCNDNSFPHMYAAVQVSQMADSILAAFPIETLTSQPT